MSVASLSWMSRDIWMWVRYKAAPRDDRISHDFSNKQPHVFRAKMRLEAFETSMIFVHYATFLLSSCFIVQVMHVVKYWYRYQPS